ncbi:MAG: hypothetical protein FAF04_03980 [Epsilonproteobacteria bacterium]|nr:hypothetical protein [Campylobacterota bacterium]
MLNLEQALELTGLEKQLFDLSLIQYGNNLDEFIAPKNIEKALEKTGVYAEDDATDKEKEGSIDDETAAGSEAVVGHLQEDSFLARDNGFVDVQSSLRDAQFNGSGNAANIDATPVLLTNEDIEAPEDTFLSPDTTAPTVTINDITTTTDDTPTFSGTSSNTDGDLTLTVNDKEYTVTPDSDGNWSFTLPDADALDDGDYTATIAGSDAQGNEASADDDFTVDADTPDTPSVTITEDINNDAKLTNDEISEDTDISIGLPSDVQEGDVLNLTINGNTTNITLTAAMISAGEYLTSVTPPAEGETLNVSAAGTDSVTRDYTTVTTSDTNTIDEDTTATGNVLSNDTDQDDTLEVVAFTIDGDSNTYNAGDTVTIVNIGTLQVNSDGGYTFTPIENWSGAVPQVTYITNTGVSDTLDIAVSAVADAPIINMGSVDYVVNDFNSSFEGTDGLYGWNSGGTVSVDSDSLVDAEVTDSNGVQVDADLTSIDGSQHLLLKAEGLSDDDIAVALGVTQEDLSAASNNDNSVDGPMLRQMYICMQGMFLLLTITILIRNLQSMLLIMFLMTTLLL